MVKVFVEFRRETSNTKSSSQNLIKNVTGMGLVFILLAYFVVRL